MNIKIGTLLKAKDKDSRDHEGYIFVYEKLFYPNIFESQPSTVYYKFVTQNSCETDDVSEFYLERHYEFVCD